MRGKGALRALSFGMSGAGLAMSASGVILLLQDGSTTAGARSGAPVGTSTTTTTTTTLARIPG